MPKGLWLLLPAVFVDFLQAGTSMTLLALGASLGTVGGAAGGYAAGQALCNSVGLSWVSSVCGVAVGTVGALGGTAADPALATIGVPLGIALGFAINICISMTFGVALVLMPLFMMRMIYPGYLFFGLGEVIPGIDNLPFWSALVIMSVIRKRKESKMVLFSGKTLSIGAVTGLAAAALAPETLAGGLLSKTFALRTQATGHAGAAGYQPRTTSVTNEEKYNTSAGRIPALETRTIMQDVRRRAPQQALAHEPQTI